jgi:hypothetical protein
MSPAVIGAGLPNGGPVYGRRYHKRDPPLRKRKDMVNLAGRMAGRQGADGKAPPERRRFSRPAPLW